jgi:pimeloyl-ACP methyl ester carboxylesterase
MIYVLPGMGADHRMYPPPWPSLPDSTFIDWPAYAGEQSLTEVARSIVAKHSLSNDAWLVGSSLGGMVACEIASLLPVRGLILVGSAISKEELSVLFTWLSPFIDLAPLNLIQQLAGKVPAELTQMFRDSDPAFVRAMCRAIVRWDGLAATQIELHRIHGSKDLVIPRPAGVQHVLDGGHLIAMTHAPECMALIEKIIANTR